MDEIADRELYYETPLPRKTIKRFTSHENGTLYGSPTKSRDGSTKLKNLFLAGTDQGYIGIVGAMLGGIAVANNQILRSA
jgi:phytoene dehydrogenase-like protein